MSNSKRYLPGSNPSNHLSTSPSNKKRTRHPPVIALLMALLMIISVFTPYGKAITNDNSGSFFMGTIINTNLGTTTQQPQQTQEPEQNNPEPSQLVSNSTFIVRMLSGSSSTGWWSALLSDPALLQRLREAMYQFTTNGSMNTRDNQPSRRPSNPDDDNGHRTPPPVEEEPVDSGDDDDDDEQDPTDPDEQDPTDPGDEDEQESSDPDEENPADPDEQDPTDPDDKDPVDSGDDDDDAPLPFFTLTLTIQGEGTVTTHVYGEVQQDTGKIKEGSKLTLTAQPAEDHVFLHWLLEDEHSLHQTTEPKVSIHNIQNDLGITAVFENQNDDEEIIIPPTYTVTIAHADTGGGTAAFHASHDTTELSHTFSEHDEVTLVATSRPLYQFLHWEKVDGTSSDSDTITIAGSEYTFAMPAENVVLTPVFQFNHPFEGGTGQEGDPYQIKTPQQLALLQGNKPQLDAAYAAYEKAKFQINLMKAHYQLVADIDLSTYSPAEGWKPIGGSGPTIQDAAFKGIFDGKKHTIKNLTIHQPEASFQAMFHTIGPQGIVKNLTLLDPSIKALTHGAVLAVNNQGTVDGVLVKSTKTQASPLNPTPADPAGPVVVVGELVQTNSGMTKSSHLAGLVVYNLYNLNNLNNRNGGMITKSGVEASIEAAGIGDMHYVGLLAAENEGTIQLSYAIGTTMRPKNGELENFIDFHGGLVGINANGGETLYNATIKNSYAIVAFQGRSTRQGGFAGILPLSENIEDGIKEHAIQYVYAVSTVRNIDDYTHEFGGLLGSNRARTLVHSYYDESLLSRIGNTSGEGKKTTEMKDKTTYGNWDFVNIWAIDGSQDNPINNGYPYLKWQQK